MRTYLTEAEFLLLYPDGYQYEPEQISQSIEESFSLVNQFINPAINTPAINKDGSIPGCLKTYQRQFTQYLLEYSNTGYTDELKNLWDSVSDKLTKITEKQIFVSELQIAQNELGYNLSDGSFASGSIYVKGIPSFNESFKVTSLTSSFVEGSSFEFVRSDSEQVYATIDGSFSEWQTVETSSLSVRFDGQFFISESVTLTGIADEPTNKITTTGDSIQQQSIAFNS